MNTSIKSIAEKARACGLEVLTSPAGKLVLLVPFITLNGSVVTSGRKLCPVDNIEHLAAMVGA